MASASSSLAAAVPPKKHDVFISFRGQDTGDNFTSHLHAALCRNKIETYIDNRLDEGDEVWLELVRAIQGTSVFLIIFSENYASSTWCLNELIEIMERKKKGPDVIPVFYRIDPSLVRKQTGSYQIAFAKHEQDLKHSEDKMNKWKDALCEGANLAGFDSRVYRTEFDLIEDIIKDVLRKLNHKYSNELIGHPILDQNYDDIESLLRIESREVRIIGIWGMGGIGKTTIAAAIFHKVSSQYEGSCFLENVRDESKRHGLNYICNRLFSELLREDLHIDTPKVISSVVMSRLRRKKVFIVLDDVNTSELLENLVRGGHDCLGAGSRVIVTSRDKHVLISGGVQNIHEVKEMNFQNSLKLFSFNAFNKTHPEKRYEELSKRAVVYAKGIPLALKVLGSFLRSKSENEWDGALKKLKKIPSAEIQKVMRLSYDELDDTEKNIFLDIACCLRGYERNYVTRLLNACDFYADIGIRNLLDKALITTTPNNNIEMHDLMQEMGWEIVREESIKNPGARSRLWDSKEVCDVLKNNSGTDAVEAIFLDMTQITDIHLSSEAFSKMSNLRLLSFNGLWDGKIINSVYLPKGLGLLPNNLRYFGWDGYPLRSLPSTFCPEKLVELDMQYSNVKKLWNGVQNLPSLEKIDLGFSTHLIECPNLSGAPNLKCVALGRCDSLPHVHPSIFSLQKLEILIVTGCKALRSLCSNSCSPSLQRLVAAGCSNLQQFSVPMPGDHSIEHLYLDSTALNELPSSILHLKNLGEFSFPISDSLLDLPEYFANQIMLTDSRDYESDALITLRKVLPSPAFRYVRHLIFIYCHSLSELPDNISLLSSLEDLSLRGSDIISLPESIKYLPRLRHLDVSCCKMLQFVPVLPQSIQSFHALNCKSLKTVLSSTREPPKKHKGTFLFHNCTELDQDSYDTILKDAIVRIELGAKPLSTVVLEDKDDACKDEDDDVDDETYIFGRLKSGKICYFLPARSGKVRDWFHYCSTQALVTIELPPNSNFLGLAFYFVLSQVQLCGMNHDLNLGCECYMETSWGETVDITSFFIEERFSLSFEDSIETMSDHVFLWYDAQCCKQMIEAIKGRKAVNDGCTTYNPKLTCKFFARKKENELGVVKECGLRWIYPVEDQIFKEEGVRKTKRSREIHELEATAVRNGVEGFDKQEEPVPPIKKFKQYVFGTPSNLEAEEVKDLRLFLEERLHIGEDLK